MKRILPILLAATACTAADIPSVSLDDHVLHQWSATGYLPATVIGGTALEQDPLSGTIEHKLSATWSPGMAGSLGWQRVSFDSDGNGWYLGASIASESMHGKLDSDEIGGVENSSEERRLWMQALLGRIGIGYTRRWDSEAIRSAPHDWQLDIGPVVGAGTAQVMVGHSGWSSDGIAYTVGIRARLSAAVSAHWRIGGEIGGDYTRTRVHWVNTDDGDFEAVGPILGATLIYER